MPNGAVGAPQLDFANIAAVHAQALAHWNLRSMQAIEISAERPVQEQQRKE